MMIGFVVRIHHMFATGIPPLALFGAASMPISIPSAVATFAYIAAIWLGHLVFRVPFLFFAGFVLMFVIGGVSGVMTAAVPFDWQLTDTYFVWRILTTRCSASRCFRYSAASTTVSPSSPAKYLRAVGCKCRSTISGRITSTDAFMPLATPSGRKAENSVSEKKHLARDWLNAYSGFAGCLTSARNERTTGACCTCRKVRSTCRG